MNFLKKLIIPINIAISFLISKVALAQNTDPLSRLQRTGLGASLPDTEADPQRIIVNIVVYILGFVAIFFLGSIIYAGYQWMASGGNEENISKAKNRLKNSIIGIVIIVSSYTVTLFVNDAIYKATCTDGYYCPPSRPQETGECGTDADCEDYFGSDNWGCNKYNSCMDNSCSGDNADEYCYEIFSEEHVCQDNRCRIPD